MIISKSVVDVLPLSRVIVQKRCVPEAHQSRSRQFLNFSFLDEGGACQASASYRTSAARGTTERYIRPSPYSDIFAPPLTRAFEVLHILDDILEPLQLRLRR